VYMVDARREQEVVHRDIVTEVKRRLLKSE
jgi:hypothetical protein